MCLNVFIPPTAIIMLPTKEIVCGMNHSIRSEAFFIPRITVRRQMMWSNKSDRTIFKTGDKPRKLVRILRAAKHTTTTHTLFPQQKNIPRVIFYNATESYSIGRRMLLLKRVSQRVSFGKAHVLKKI